MTRTPMPNRIAAVESGGNALCLRGTECAGCQAVRCACGARVCAHGSRGGRCNRCDRQPSSAVVREHVEKREPVLRDRTRVSSWLSLEMLP